MKTPKSLHGASLISSTYLSPSEEKRSLNLGQLNQVFCQSVKAYGQCVGV